MHEARATIKFDFSELNIPVDKKINDVKLAIYRTHEPKLNQSYGYDQNGQIFCNPSKVDWSISIEGFRTLFPKIVDAYDVKVGDTLNYIKNTIDWLEFDVTDIASEMIAEPSSNNGFILRGFISGSAPTSWGTVGNVAVFDNPGHSGINGGYASSENSDISLRPKLIISYGEDTDIKGSNINIKTDISILKQKNKMEIIGISGKYVEITFLALNGRLLSKNWIDANQTSVTFKIPNVAQKVLVLQIKSENLNISKKVIR